jgi:hypothetical protein
MKIIPSKKTIPMEWRNYHFYDVVAHYLLLVGWMPAVIIGWCLKSIVGLDLAQPYFTTLLIFWVLLWGYFAIKLVHVPCPRCQSPWLNNQNGNYQFLRKCANCQLGLYEKP